ncbi:MAG: cobalamin-binding protein [Armatimonadota bacterium]|nr:cobalamin-binding protein [Armatimonadota bacterium]MDR5697214.1 cobalamin-binding protein [Armatimonadota bacterium]
MRSVRRRARRLRCVGCLVALGAALAAPAVGASPLVVTDALGQRLVFSAPPRRIVSIAPSVTEILFAIGASSQVVGVSSADDHPPDVRHKPRVGGVHLDYERIASLRPDLVVGVAGLQRPALERLRALGHRVMAIDPRTLRQTYQAILTLGAVTGRAGAAMAVVEGMRGREARVVQAVAGLPRPRVFVEVWDQPFMTAGRDTFVDDLLRLARGANVFGDLVGWPQVSEEQIVARDPEVILSMGTSAQRILGREGWGRIAAVRNRRVYALTPAWVSRPGPRLVLGLEQIASRLHADRFR